MKHWKVASLLLCALMVGFLVMTSAAFGQEKSFNLSYSILFPGPHKHSVLASEWAKEIEKRTNGKVKITMHYGGTLTAGPQIYDGVVKGISDIGMSVPGYTRGRFPLTEVMELPLGYKSGWAATKLVTDFYDKFKPKEWDDVKMMFMHSHGPGLLHTKKPVQKLEDLRGMKIRAFGTVAKMVTALGGLPVSMPMPETYEALSRGVVEASIAPYEALQGWKWGEVVKYTIEAPAMAYSGPFFVAMNKDKWNALPADVQKIIKEVNGEYAEKHGKGWDEIDKAGKDFVLKLGNQVITIAADENRRWGELLQPLYDEYVKSMKDKGLPGDEALKFVQAELKKIQQ